MGIRMEVRGERQVLEAIRRAGKRQPEALRGALYKLGVAIISEALPLTPVKYGVLRSSAYVGPPSPAPRISVRLGYGTEYAVRQHEETTYRHPRGGQAKYLQTAIQRVAPRAGALLQRWMGELAKSGRGWAKDSAVSTAPRPKLALASRARGQRAEGVRRNRRFGR